MSDPQTQAASQRLAGIAALRQLRRLVDAEQAEDAAKTRRAKRLSLILLGIGLCAFAFYALRVLAR